MGGGGESAEHMFRCMRSYLVGHDPARLEEMRFKIANPTGSLYNNRTQVLAARGSNPLTGHSVVSPKRARRINALMLTCGHYDGSGDFAYHVGLPGKSGVGGGILAVAPGIGSIAVWSPGLNKVGNSQLGAVALEMLAARTGWSVFGD